MEERLKSRHPKWRFPNMVAIPNAHIINYDIKVYPFREMISKTVFRVPELRYLHRYWSRQSKKDTLSYQDNLSLRAAMQNLSQESDFYKIYHPWVANIIGAKVGRKLSYSLHPKFRVHLSGTQSASGFHRDAHITKRPEQINVYLPFTDVFDGNTLWCEDDYGSENFIPLNLTYGQALLWDGGYLKHGTVINDTGFTRVSCDFRFHYKDESLADNDIRSVLSGRPADLYARGLAEVSLLFIRPH